MAQKIWYDGVVDPTTGEVEPNPLGNTPIDAAALNDLEARKVEQSQLSAEVAARQAADAGLQASINTIVASGGSVTSIGNIIGLQAALDSLQSAATAATDAELANAVTTLTNALTGKQDAATAATDSEVAAALVIVNNSLAGKQDAASAATDTELANAIATVNSVVSGKLSAALLGAANGVASLDSNGTIPDAQIPASIARDTEVAATAATLVPLTQKGAANGVATLDSGTTIPDAQIPATIARDAEVSGAITAATTGLIPSTQKGVANGVASLDSGGQIPDAQIPAAITRDTELSSAVGNLIPTSQKGAVNGVASLDSSGKVPTAQLPSAASVSDATTTSKGIVQLAGDLGGTAASPTVPGLASKADASALAGKQDTSAKGAANGYAGLDGTGKVPAAQLPSSSSAPDATTSVKGLVQLAGDLGGTAAAPTVPSLSTKVNTSTLGQPNGVATLASNGKVPTAQLPSSITATGFPMVVIMGGADGVVGDGSADDTDKIVLLLNGLSETTTPYGGDVYWKWGKYKVRPNSIIFEVSGTDILFEGGCTISCPTAAAGDRILWIAQSNINISGQVTISGSGPRGNGIGVAYGPTTPTRIPSSSTLNTGVHSCYVQGITVSNCEAGADMGISDPANGVNWPANNDSSGDNALSDFRAKDCKDAVRSRGFVNKISDVFIDSCDYGIRCTSDRSSGRLTANSVTINNCYEAPISIERGSGHTFRDIWIEQNSRRANQAAIAVIGGGGVASSCLFKGAINGHFFDTPEDYGILLKSGATVKVDEITMSINGAGFPGIAVIGATSTFTGRCEVDRVSYKASNVPAGWNSDLLVSKHASATGTITVRSAPEVSGSGAGTCTQQVTGGTADYIASKTTPLNSYLITDRSGGVVYVGTSLSTAVGKVPAGKTVHYRHSDYVGQTWASGVTAYGDGGNGTSGSTGGTITEGTATPSDITSGSFYLKVDGSGNVLSLFAAPGGFAGNVSIGSTTPTDVPLNNLYLLTNSAGDTVTNLYAGVS